MDNVQNFVNELKKLSTPSVSDALDKLKIKGGCENLRPVTTGKKIVGPALTVKYVPIGEDTGTVGDYIDQAQNGDVIVLDNNGRTDCTVWGDILTYVATSKGIAGTIIDGVCRDIEGIKELDYPMFSRGQYMVTGKDRVMQQSVNQTVSISNVQVRPGDIIMADDSGVLAIPCNRVEEVLKVAKEIDEAEQMIIEEVKKGSTLGEARDKFRYNELQRSR